MKFKVGDNVKAITSPDGNGELLGKDGVIIEVKPKLVRLTYFVNFSLPISYTWWCEESALELVETKITGGTMIYQVAVESVKLATASTPEKKTILFGPETVEAKSDKEAILLASSKHAKVISEAVADQFEVSVKQF